VLERCLHLEAAHRWTAAELLVCEWLQAL